MSKNTFKQIIQQIFFPVNYTCNACGKEVFSGKYFCENCYKKLPFIKINKCNHCGRITPYAVAYCDSCVENNVSFDVARSVFDYVDPVDKLIKDFKYNGKRYLAEVFASEMKNFCFSEFIQADVIAYVPMTEERLKFRGYNQAKLLAYELASLLNAPVSDTLIEKVIETPRQANLTKVERRSNLDKSFKVSKSEANGKSVLLIDDVLTTGTTADVIAKELKRKGAVRVNVLTVASVQNEKIKPTSVESGDI